MTKLFLVIGLVSFSGVVIGQGRMGGKTGAMSAPGLVPLQADNWNFDPGAVKFGPAPASLGGGPAMTILDGRAIARLKNVDFSDGTIEYDYLPSEKIFASMYFRWQDQKESECFYFRMPFAGHPQAMQAIQYTPVMDGINCWNLYGYYQTNASFNSASPIHVKLVVSGRQLRVFVNKMDIPALEVPRLEGNTTHGSIVFEGQSTVANLSVRPGQVEGLDAKEGYDPTINDPRYIRHWQVTAADSLPRGIDFDSKLMPDSNTVWKPIVAERRGLVNLTRLYGAAGSKRIAWLRATIHSDDARNCTLRLGYLNEVWVWVNGHLLYVDKNYYGEPIAKQLGRLSIDNSAMTVPLQQGDNEILIGLGNLFYGWGIAARLDDTNGIELR